jgi:TPR repeat protein
MNFIYNDYIISEKNNEVKKSNLNDKEINELKQFFNCQCFNSFINNYSRKNYNLFINKIIFEPNANNTDYIDDLYYLGVYYQFIHVNYNLMKKYYLQAIEKGNSDSMNNLGLYYKNNEENDDLMKKYYLQAIEKGNTEAMNNLGYYYQFTERKYDLAKKYYLQAIGKGNYESINNLGFYYQYTEKNYDLMRKYYLMAFVKDSSSVTFSLGQYYQHIEENFDLMKKYYLQAIEKGNSKAMVCLGNYYKFTGNYDLMKKYYIQAIEKGNYYAMEYLGHYYQYRERNYDLMEKYLLMAIDNENDQSVSIVMNDLGRYYEYEKKYDLMKKYYLMATEKGNPYAAGNLDYYYMHNLPNNDDLQNYFSSLNNGNINFKDVNIFDDNYIEKDRIINLFCLGIDNNNLGIDNFEFCLCRIINYINSCKSHKPCELQNIKHFARYVMLLYYHHNEDKKNKWEYKKCINIIFMKCASQIFIEYLNFYYYEYLKKIFAPGGEGYIKTKKHFELVVIRQ